MEGKKCDLKFSFIKVVQSAGFTTDVIESEDVCGEGELI